MKAAAGDGRRAADGHCRDVAVAAQIELRAARRPSPSSPGRAQKLSAAQAAGLYGVAERPGRGRRPDRVLDRRERRRRQRRAAAAKPGRAQRAQGPWRAGRRASPRAPARRRRGCRPPSSEKKRASARWTQGSAWLTTAWPAPGTRTSVPSRIAATVRRASSDGVRRSAVPDSTSACGVDRPGRGRGRDRGRRPGEAERGADLSRGGGRCGRREQGGAECGDGAVARGLAHVERRLGRAPGLRLLLAGGREEERVAERFGVRVARVRAGACQGSSRSAATSRSSGAGSPRTAAWIAAGSAARRAGEKSLDTSRSKSSPARAQPRGPSASASVVRRAAQWKAGAPGCRTIGDAARRAHSAAQHARGGRVAGRVERAALVLGDRRVEHEPVDAARERPRVALRDVGAVGDAEQRRSARRPSARAAPRGRRRPRWS